MALSFWLTLVLVIPKSTGKEDDSQTGDLHLGAYRQVSNIENPAFVAVLQEMGYTPVVIQKIQKSTRRSILRVAKRKEKYIVMFSLSFCELIPPKSTKLRSGQPYNLTLCDGRTVRAENEYDPVKKQLRRTLKMDGFEAKQLVTDITPLGFKVHYKVKGKDAKLEFVRDYADETHGRTIHRGTFFLKTDTEELMTQAYSMLDDMGYSPDLIFDTVLEGNQVSMIKIFQEGDSYSISWILFLCEDTFETEEISGEGYYLKLCNWKIAKAKNEFNPVRNELTRTTMMDGFEAKQTATDITPLGFKINFQMKDKSYDFEYLHPFVMHPLSEVIFEGAYMLKDNDNDGPFSEVLHEMGYSATNIKYILNSAIALIRVGKDLEGHWVAFWSLTICEENFLEVDKPRVDVSYALVLCDGRYTTAMNSYDPARKILTRTVNVGDFLAQQIVTDISSEKLKVHYKVKDKSADLEYVAYKYSM